MRINVKNYFFDLLSFILAFIFIVAAIEKIKSPMEFALAVNAYQIFNVWMINLIVSFIPWLELFIGFGLIFKFKFKSNLFLYLLLMIGFTAMVVIAIIKGLDIECGCYGESSKKVGFEKLIENIFIIFGALVLLLSEKFNRKK